MTIQVKCDKCGKAGKVPDEFAGNNVKCPACKESFYIPLPDEKSAPKAAQPPKPPPKKRRRILPAVFLVLLLSVAALGALFYFNVIDKNLVFKYFPQLRGTPATTDILSHIPENCSIFGEINQGLTQTTLLVDNSAKIENLIKIPEKDLSNNQKASDLKEQLKKFGPILFIKNRVERIAFGGVPQTGNSEDMPVIFVLKTKKDITDEIESLFFLYGATFEKSKGEKGIEKYLVEKGDLEFLVAINGETVILGSPSLVNSALSAPDAGGKKEIKFVYEEVRDNPIYMVWSSGEVGQRLIRNISPDNSSLDIKDISAAMFTMDESEMEGVKFRLDIHSKEKGGVQRLSSVFREELLPALAGVLGIKNSYGEEPIALWTYDSYLKILHFQPRESLGALQDRIVFLASLSGRYQASGEKKLPPGSPAPKDAFETDSGDFKEGSVEGSIHGKPFLYQNATFEDGVLTIRQGDQLIMDEGVVITTFLKSDEEIPGKVFNITSESGFAPRIQKLWRAGILYEPKSEMYKDGYVMKLEFGKIADGSINGRIRLTLPDGMNSQINGTFRAKFGEKRVVAPDTSKEDDFISKIQKKIPKKKARGRLYGRRFSVDGAELKNGVLTLWQGKRDKMRAWFHIFTFSKKDKIGGSVFILKPDTVRGPHIHRGFSFVKNKKRETKSASFTKGEMYLKFGEVKDNFIDCEIYLSLKENKKTFLSGVFKARIK